MKATVFADGDHVTWVGMSPGQHAWIKDILHYGDKVYLWCVTSDGVPVTQIPEYVRKLELN